MLTRHRIFQWQQNYLFLKKIVQLQRTGSTILNFLILIVAIIFVESLSRYELLLVKQ